MIRLAAFCGALAICLNGCSASSTSYYADTQPRLDIREYLNGKLEAWGVLMSLTGKADLRFVVQMDASWNGNVGTLKEHFSYSDGRTDQRVWTITFTDDHNFTATAGDVIGTAVGSQHGNTANMKYVLDAKRANGGTIELSMDDWLYLVDEKNLVNRTKMKKFGFTVGELLIGFRKL